MKKAIIGVGAVLLFVAAGIIIVRQWRPIQKQAELAPTQVDNGIEFDNEQNQALGKPIHIQDLKNGDIATVDLSQINQEVHKRAGSYLLPEHPFFVENPSIEMSITIIDPLHNNSSYTSIHRRIGVYDEIPYLTTTSPTIPLLHRTHGQGV